MTCAQKREDKKKSDKKRKRKRKPQKSNISNQVDRIINKQ